jgi:hypothetical protein
MNHLPHKLTELERTTNTSKLNQNFAKVVEDSKVLKSLIDSLNPSLERVSKKVTPLKSEVNNTAYALSSMDKLIGQLAKNLGKMLGQTVVNSFAGNNTELGITKMLGDMFGGGRAKGGAVTAGKSYVVGENGPELFQAGASGNIVPSNQLGPATNIVMNINTPDANSFRKSQSQIMAEVMQHLCKGSRNL